MRHIEMEVPTDVLALISDLYRVVGEMQLQRSGVAEQMHEEAVAMALEISGYEPDDHATIFDPSKGIGDTSSSRFHFFALFVQLLVNHPEVRPLLPLNPPIVPVGDLP